MQVSSFLYLCENLKYERKITSCAAGTFLSLTSCKYLHIDGYSGSTLIWESGANNYFNTESPSDLKTVNEILITGETDGDQKVLLENYPGTL